MIDSLEQVLIPDVINWEGVSCTESLKLARSDNSHPVTEPGLSTPVIKIRGICIMLIVGMP